jgi:hypothetical protein
VKIVESFNLVIGKLSAIFMSFPPCYTVFPSADLLIPPSSNSITVSEFLLEIDERKKIFFSSFGCKNFVLRRAAFYTSAKLKAMTLLDVA